MILSAREPAAADDAGVADGWSHNNGTRGFLIYLGIASAVAFVLSLHYLARAKAFTFYGFGSDTFTCFYPLQVAVGQQLKSLHAVTWSFELGLGGFLGSWFDPLWLITGWLPDRWQLSLRLPMFLSRLLLGGGFFYGYLRQIGFRAPVAVIGGLGYAFSSCGLINAQWEVMQGTEFVQLPAYLFLLETFMRGRRPWAGIAAGIVVGLGHPLGLYMFALLSVAYGTVRLVLLARAQRKDAALTLVTFAAWCVVGVALTAPLLFPALYYLFDSPRVSGDHAQLQSIASLFSLNDTWTIGSEIAGLLGKDLLGTADHYVGWQNYFEGPGFYVGLLPLLCIPQLMGPQATRRERVLFLIGISGIALYFVFPGVRYAVYAFGHQAFRFSAYWISALVLVLGLAGLQRAMSSGWWRTGVAIGAASILIIALGITVRIPGLVNVEHVARVIAFTSVYAAFALLAARTRDKSWISPYLLVAACACELLLFALPAVVERDAVGADGSSPFGRYDDGTRMALEFIRQHDNDDQFFRIEKTYSSVFLDDALVQGYSGTASYYFHASAITRFVDRMGLPRHVPHANYISSMAPRPDVLSLLGVKYVLSHDRSPDGNAAMHYVTKAGGVHVYRNDAAHTFATFYDAMGSESRADALPTRERDALLLKMAIVDDPDGIEARLQALRAGSSAPGPSRQANIRKLRDDRLYGEVATPTASLLLLTMPFDRGWSATLDGTDLPLFRADYGLTAALIPAGSHRLALDYVPPGRRLGNALAAGVAAFVTVFFFPVVRRQSRFPAWLNRVIEFIRAPFDMPIGVKDKRRRPEGTASKEIQPSGAEADNSTRSTRLRPGADH
jgi:uncharacterized membrane protein YfhO